MTPSGTWAEVIFYYTLVRDLIIMLLLIGRLRNYVFMDVSQMRWRAGIIVAVMSFAAGMIGHPNWIFRIVEVVIFSLALIISIPMRPYHLFRIMFSFMFFRWIFILLIGC